METPQVQTATKAAFEAEDHRSALFAGFLGWTLDAFDFFLVVVTLTAIAKEFHRPDKDIAFSIALTLPTGWRVHLRLAC